MSLARNVLAFSLLAFAAAAAAKVNPGPTPEALARANGCYLCHTATANPAAQRAKPLAPAWKDIADRYATQSNVEQRLVQVVLDGSGRSLAARNWRNEVTLGEMPAHRAFLTLDQAQRIVRWILTSADGATTPVAFKPPR